MTNRWATIQVLLNNILVFGVLLLIYKYNHGAVTNKVVVYLSGVSEYRHRTDFNTNNLYGPYNSTEAVVNDTYDRLIDVQNFSFIANTLVCDDYPAGLLIIVIVSSNPTHFKNREIIRTTWGRNVDTMKVVFLIGETANSTIASQISDEIEEYDDIVQGTFTDAYRNLTYKHVMGLKWVAHHCPKAKYVLKTDDDVLVYSGELRRFLVKELSPWGARDLMAGQIVRQAVVSRKKTSKWMVTTKEFPGKYYPTYLSGWAILYSQDVVRRLLKVFQDMPYFWVDDVHVTGVAAEKIGLVHTSLSKFVLNNAKIKKLKATGSISPDDTVLFGRPNLSVAKIEELWKLVQNRSKY